MNQLEGVSCVFVMDEEEDIACIMSPMLDVFKVYKSGINQFAWEQLQMCGINVLVFDMKSLFEDDGYYSQFVKAFREGVDMSVVLKTKLGERLDQ